MGVLSRIIGCVCLSVLLLAAPAAANTIHVAASNATGIEDGTAAHPFRTIAQGIMAARSGLSWDDADVVLVQPGYYSGYFYLKNFVKLQGTDPKTVLVAGYVSGPFGVGIPNLWIEGVTVMGGGILAWNRGILTDPSFWEVRDCCFRNAAIPIYARGAANINLTRCLMYYYENALHLLYTSGTTNLLNCTLDFGNCENEGIGIHFPDPENRVVLTNSIISNTHYAIATWDSAWNSGTGTSGWQVTADHCDFWNGLVPADMAQIDCLNANPLYRGYTGGGYSVWETKKLSALSPCIDAGIPVGLPFLGAAPDIGAFEYDPAAPPPPPLPPPPEPTLAELLQNLATSYSSLDQESLKSPSEQRRDAFCNKMDAVLHQFAHINDDLTTDKSKVAAYRTLRDKLTGDLLAKCDGSSGGDPGNDWIREPSEIALFSKLINRIILLVDAEITRLGG